MKTFYTAMKNITHLCITNKNPEITFILIIDKHDIIQKTGLFTYKSVLVRLLIK
jgi:hypothetical protein